MLELYFAEKQRKEKQERLDGVEKKAWKWFGERSFCKRCLLEELNGKLTVE